MANGPGGTEVGRVYIRVLPNTAEFAAKLKAAIKSMGEDVKVGIDLNTSSAEARIKELTRKSKISIVADADTAKAEAQVERLAERKQIVIQAQALTAKAAADLDALTNRRRDLSIRVSAITSMAATQLAALDRQREVVIEAHLNDQSIAKAEARIQALDRRRELVLSIDTKQVTKRFNRLKAQMRHLTSQLDIETDPAAIARIRAQLAEASRGFTLMGDIKLKGREEVAAQLEALKKRYQVVIDARTTQVDKALAKIESEMAAIRDKRTVHLNATWDGSRAKGEYEAWQRSIKNQVSKVSIALDTAVATADWESYKALVEKYRVQLNADLDTARASTDAARLKTKIESLRIAINTQLNAKQVEAELQILTRGYSLELDAKVKTAEAMVSLENLAKDRKVYFKAVLDTKKAMVQFSELDRRRIVEVHAELKNSLQVQAELIKLGRRRDVQFGVELKRSAKLEAELAWLTRDRTIHVNVRPDFKTKLFNKFNGQIKRSTGLLGSLKTVAKGAGALIGGALAQGLGKLVGDASEAGSALMAVGKAMTSSVASSLPQLGAAAVQAAVTLAGLAAIGGVVLAVFAGLTATILSVAAALLGMVAALAMLAVALVGGLIGVAALAALPALFVAGALMMRSESDRLMKSVKRLGTTAKSVLKKSFEPMVKAFETEIPKMETWLKSLQPELKKTFQAASKHLDSFRIGLQQFVDQLLPQLRKSMDTSGFQKFMDAIGGTNKELGLFGMIGKAIGDSFKVLADNGGKFAGVAKEIGRGLGEVLPAMAGFLAATATGAEKTGQIADGIAGMFDELAASFNNALGSKGWGDTVAGISDMMKKFGDAIGSGFEQAMKHGEEFKGAFSALGDFMQGISKPLADFTGSAAGQFAAVMPSVTQGFQEIIPAMQRMTESFAKFAPGVVKDISSAIAELFDYLARPDVAQRCAELTKAFVKFAKTALGPDTLDTMLSLAQIVMDFANLIAPLIPLLLQFFMITSGFKLAGVLVGGFGKNLLGMGTALSAASGKTGKLGKVLASVGTKFKGVSTILKGGLMKTLGSIGTKLVQLGPKITGVGAKFGKAALAFVKGGARMIATLARVLLRTIVFAARMAAQWFIAMGPIGWIALIVAGLVALIIIYWDEIVAYAKIAWEYIYTNAVKPVVDACIWLWGQFVTFMSGMWEAIKVGASACWEAIKFIVQVAIQVAIGWILGLVRGAISAWNNIKAGASVAWSSIKTYIGGVLQSVRDKFSQIKGNISTGWNSIKERAAEAWRNIRTGFSGAMEDVKGAASDMVDWVVGKFEDLKSRATSVLSNLNPASWFSAPIEMSLKVNTPKLDAMSLPVTASPLASTFAGLTADNPWKQDAEVFGSGIDQANKAWNSSTAIAGMLDMGTPESRVSSSRRGSPSVVVNANTNANANEIGKEVAWALRRK